MILKIRARSTFAAIALVVLAATSACGGSSSGEIESIDDLRKAFEKAGGDCQDWVQNDRLDEAVASGDCGDDTVLSMYANHKDAQAAAEGLIARVPGVDELLVGADWIVNAAQDLEELQKRLGGKVVTGLDAEVAKPASESAFVSDVRRVVPSLAGIADPTVVQFGEVACDTLRQVGDFDQAVDNFTSTAEQIIGDADGLISIVMATAVRDLCPELSGMAVEGSD